MNESRDSRLTDQIHAIAAELSKLAIACDIKIEQEPDELPTRYVTPNAGGRGVLEPFLISDRLGLL